VPEVLLSGDHKRIAEWRRQEGERLTRERLTRDRRTTDD
jgi:tRNA (guanine37-N1)-methyltransferase